MKAVKAISSVALAVLVLISSSSFTVGMHYCMGEVQDIAFFTKAEACEKEQSLPPCHRPADSCCADETITHSGNDLQASGSVVQVFTPHVVDIASTPVLIAELIPSAHVAVTHYTDYDPPLRFHDLIVEHRVFLI